MTRWRTAVWLGFVALALCLFPVGATEWFPLFDCDDDGEAECYCRGIGASGPTGCQEIMAVVREPDNLPRCASCGGTWSPQPEATASSAAGPSGYFEDFTERKPWYSGSWDERGFVEIRLSEEGKLRSVECPTPANETTYEVDVVFTKHTRGMAGVLLLSREEDGWDYGIFLDPNGRFYLYWISPSGDTWNPVRSGAAPGAARGLNNINHLTIELTETNTYISFNDSKAFTANAVIPLGGYVRLAVANFEDETVVRFDNLHFHSPETSPMTD